MQSRLADILRYDIFPLPRHTRGGLFPRLPELVCVRCYADIITSEGSSKLHSVMFVFFLLHLDTSCLDICTSYSSSIFVGFEFTKH